MALEGTIYITISDERGSGGGGATPKPTPEPKKVEEQAQQETDNNVLGEYARVQFYNFMTSQAKQFVNYTIGNIGNFTGDYNRQRHVQQIVSIGNSLKAIGISVYAGFTAGGVVGGVIAGALAVASQGINFAYSEYSNNFAIKKQNREITELRKLVGLDSLTNGSRQI